MDPADLKKIPNEVWYLMDDPGMADVWPAPRSLQSLLDLVESHDPKTASEQEKRLVSAYLKHKEG